VDLSFEINLIVLRVIVQLGKVTLKIARNSLMLSNLSYLMGRLQCHIEVWVDIGVTNWITTFSGAHQYICAQIRRYVIYKSASELGVKSSMKTWKKKVINLFLHKWCEYNATVSVLCECTLIFKG